MFYNILSFIRDAEGNIQWGVIAMLILVVVAFAGMFLLPMFTNKNRSAQVNDLYGNLSVGDKVMTIGGIIGTIVRIKTRSTGEKEILIEPGEEGSKTSLWLDQKGIYQNLTKPPIPTNFFGKPKTEAAPAVAATTVSETVTDAESNPFDGEETKEEVSEVSVVTETASTVNEAMEKEAETFNSEAIDSAEVKDSKESASEAEAAPKSSAGTLTLPKVKRTTSTRKPKAK
ncbi:MAG: preprotein translocase subunit YajC [Firmicutes bacterium]|nr:preprotein translocase subunit YajC [Bacillota bacterium]